MVGYRQTVRRVRCHYASASAFIEALGTGDEPNTINVFTTESFDPGEELLLEVYFAGLPGKMMVRAIGQEWHIARPRLRVRAGGTLRCTGPESRKLSFLRGVANGRITLTARRRHVRLPVLVEIRWRRPQETRYTMAALSELSEGGALLLSGGDLALGEEVIVEILPPGAVRPTEILSTVRNVDNPEGVGIEFMARDAGGVHRLREIIRRIIEQ